MIFFFWFIFRVLTSVIVALASSLRPITPIEQVITLLPPSQPFGLWIERAMMSPWLRWDAEWYQRIVEQGYDAVDGTAQFHPLYPLLASIFYWMGFQSIFSLLLISSIAGLGFLFLYHRLARLDLSPPNANFSLLFVLLVPISFILFAPYSEALFLLMAASCFYFARNQSWMLAGLAGGLAVLTRQQGLLLIFPLAWELWEASGRSWQRARTTWRNWVPLFFLPTSYILWLGYRSIVLNDFSPNLHSFHNLIYSVLISPSAQEVVPHQSFIYPWKALFLSLNKVGAAPDVDIWVNLVSAGFFLVLFILGWKDMRPAYRLYAVAITLISFSYYTGPLHPYMGLPRHLLLAFPICISTTPRLNRPIIGPLIIIILSIGYLFMPLLYSFETWIP